MVRLQKYDAIMKGICNEYGIPFRFQPIWMDGPKLALEQSNIAVREVVTPFQSDIVHMMFEDERCTILCR